MTNPLLHTHSKYLVNQSTMNHQYLLGNDTDHKHGQLNINPALITLLLLLLLLPLANTTANDLAPLPLLCVWCARCRRFERSWRIPKSPADARSRRPEYRARSASGGAAVPRWRNSRRKSRPRSTTSSEMSTSGYADIFVRLYMVGSRTASSRPVIMVCCTDARVRGDVETEIRKSGLLDQFPEFATGQSALPLELPGP